VSLFSTVQPSSEFYVQASCSRAPPTCASCRPSAVESLRRCCAPAAESSDPGQTLRGLANCRCACTFYRTGQIRPRGEILRPRFAGKSYDWATACSSLVGQCSARRKRLFQRALCNMSHAAGAFSENSIKPEFRSARRDRSKRRSFLQLSLMTRTKRRQRVATRSVFPPGHRSQEAAEQQAEQRALLRSSPSRSAPARRALPVADRAAAKGHPRRHHAQQAFPVRAAA